MQVQRRITKIKIKMEKELDKAQAIMLQIVKEMAEEDQDLKVVYSPGKDEMTVRKSSGTVVKMYYGYDEYGHSIVKLVVSSTRQGIGDGNAGIIASAIKKIV